MRVIWDISENEFINIINIEIIKVIGCYEPMLLGCQRSCGVHVAELFTASIWFITQLPPSRQEVK